MLKVPVSKHEVVALYKSGKSLAEVGSQFGVSRERVRQIVSGLGVSKLEGGATIRSFTNTRDKVEALRAKDEREESHIRSLWGMSLDDYKAHIAEHGTSTKSTSPMRKYIQHRSSAKKRGIGWDFNFAQWWQVWQDSGKWSERGRGPGYHGYVMARFGDADTPYSVDTVYICTQSQNSKDSFIVSPAANRWAGERSATVATEERAKKMRAEYPPRATAKVTEDQVRAIRADTRRGTIIAATYGVSTATISQIKTGKAWQNVV